MIKNSDLGLSYQIKYVIPSMDITSLLQGSQVLHLLTSSLQQTENNQSHKMSTLHLN